LTNGGNEKKGITPFFDLAMLMINMSGVFPRRFNSEQIRQEENKNVKIVM
jgi:hypothetical protein